MKEVQFKGRHQEGHSTTGAAWKTMPRLEQSPSKVFLIQNMTDPLTSIDHLSQTVDSQLWPCLLSNPTVCTTGSVHVTQGRHPVELTQRNNQVTITESGSCTSTTSSTTVAYFWPS
eukprot:scpid60680/ scgid23198/ 